VTTVQRFTALVALSATVFLGGWMIGLLAGFGSPGTWKIQAPPIEDHGSPHSIKAVTAALELVDPPQATATLSKSDVATPVFGPEPMVVSAPLINVSTDDLASLEPVASVAKGFNPQPPLTEVTPAATSAEAASAHEDSFKTDVVLASVPIAEIPVSASLSDAPQPLREMRSLGSLFTSDALKHDPKPAVRPVETPSECPAPEICIDDYLWALYERTPKIDTNKVIERIKIKAKVTVKKKKKLLTVTKTIIKTNTKYVVGDFTWKDPIAAQRVGMSLKDYVIGGMNPGFKLKLYRAVRAMEDAGHMPGITSAFRDDYRQSIASGHKAASDSSYHGGRRRGGYGHGLAADLVSVKGETRSQRYASSQELWKWIDAREKELGIGRPYLDRDPPHVGPLDGAEYAAKRGRLIAQKTEVQS
jgi:transposase-like protein